MESSYTKDKKTKILINNDIQSYQSVIAQRKKSKQIMEMQKDIEKLKETVRLLQEKIG